jgi:hypothetical protein
MSKELFSLTIADVSAFARSLGAGLHERHPAKPEPPGQVELLNLIARTQGQRNWPALRHALRPAPPPALGRVPASSLAAAPGGVPARAPAATPTLTANARKALAQFDDLGRLMRWPVKFSVQKLAMWVLWTHFDAKRPYTEREVNAILKAANAFGDHVTLRRELINHRLMSRLADCSEYRKLPARPDEETRALLGAWRARQREAA